MKTILIGIAAIAIFTAAACNDSNTQTAESNTHSDSAQQESTTTMQQPGTANDNNSVMVSSIVSGYLQTKNALAKDNGNEAASGGKAMVDALTKVDKSSLSAAQSKAYEDIAADMQEHAKHISENAGKIEHQREHFSMLSGDMYDFVKAFGSSEKLYKDFCPMYNSGKGGVWLSETKDIKNPYLGTKMPTCGTIKEEIAANAQ